MKTKIVLLVSVVVLLSVGAGCQTGTSLISTDTASTDTAKSVETSAAVTDQNQTEQTVTVEADVATSNADEAEVELDGTLADSDAIMDSVSESDFDSTSELADDALGL